MNFVYLARDVKYKNESLSIELINKAKEIRRMLSGLVNAVGDFKRY